MIVGECRRGLVDKPYARELPSKLFSARKFYQAQSELSFPTMDENFRPTEQTGTSPSQGPRKKRIF